MITQSRFLEKTGQLKGGIFPGGVFSVTLFDEIKL
jgi:hypothetical protein